MLPDDPGIRPRVVKLELYETSSPPGNNGGAVSGAAPCPLADITQSKEANKSNAHFRQGQSGLRKFKTFLPGDVIYTRMRKPEFDWKKNQMRRGRMLGRLKIGGAWDWPLMSRSEIVMPDHRTSRSTAPKATGVKEMETLVG
jgi:hypothetical protein